MDERPPKTRGQQALKIKKYIILKVYLRSHPFIKFIPQKNKQTIIHGICDTVCQMRLFLVPGQKSYQYGKKHPPPFIMMPTF